MDGKFIGQSGDEGTAPTPLLIWEVVRMGSAFWLFYEEERCMKESAGSPGLESHRGEVSCRLGS